MASDVVIALTASGDTHRIASRLFVVLLLWFFICFCANEDKVLYPKRGVKVDSIKGSTLESHCCWKASAPPFNRSHSLIDAFTY